jgi:hypothetical protein
MSPPAFLWLLSSKSHQEERNIYLAMGYESPTKAHH